MASSSSSQQLQEEDRRRQQQQPPSFDSFLSLSLRPSTSGTRVDVGPVFGTSWARSTPRLKIVALGDSITQMAAFSDGWLSLLTARYQRRADVFNRGYSGYSTRNALPLVRQQIADGHWPYTPAASSSSSSSSASSFSQLLIIGLGTNDAVLPPEVINSPEFTAAQHVPVAAFAANMRKLIAMLVPEYSNAPAGPLQQFASRSTALVLLTPAQLDEPAFRAHLTRESGLPSVQTRSLEGTLPYVQAVRDIGRQWSIPVCDCWELTQPNSDGQWDVFTDGLHLSPAGNARLFEALLQVIEKQYPSLRVEVLPMDAPAFEDWDYSGDRNEEQTWPAGSLD